MTGEVRFMRTALFAVLLILLGSLPAQSDELDATAALATRLAKNPFMTAAFEQVRYDENGDEIERSSGSLHWLRPDRARWHVLQPYEQLLVSDGRFLWSYDVELEQVTQNRLSGDIQNSPLLVLSSSSDAIAEAYQVVLRQEDGGLATFELRPRSDEPMFKSVELVFEQNALQRLAFADNFSQVTAITFTGMDRENMPSVEQFTFVPPAGVDLVLDYGAGE